MKAANLRFVLALALAGLVPAAGHAAQQEHHDSSTLWKLVNTALLAGAAGYLIAKKGRGFFSDRTAAIRKEMDEAGRLKQEAEARAAEMEQKLASLSAEIGELRRAARAEMAAESDRLREEAVRQVAKIQSQAEREIASAAKAARQELKAHAADLALRLAEKKLRERMTPSADAALLDSFLAGLGGESRPAT